MTPSRSEVAKAERLARAQRLDLARLLVIEPAGASEDDLKLAARVKASATDGTSYDKALADKQVNALFGRGVLRFEMGRN